MCPSCSNCTLLAPHFSPLGASHAPYWRKQVRLRGKEQQKFPFSSNFTVGEPKRQRAQSSALIRKTALPSLDIVSYTFLDSVSNTTARDSFSWSEEKGLARLKRRDFGGMQDSSPGLRPGGDDVTASAREAWGVGRPRGSPRRACSCQGSVPIPRQASVGINRSGNGRGWLRSELPGRGLELSGRVRAGAAEGWCCSCLARRTADTRAGPRGRALLPTGVWGEHIPCALKDLFLREGSEKD